MFMQFMELWRKKRNVYKSEGNDSKSPEQDDSDLKSWCNNLWPNWGRETHLMGWWLAEGLVAGQQWAGEALHISSLEPFGYNTSAQDFAWSWIFSSLFNISWRKRSLSNLRRTARSCNIGCHEQIWQCLSPEKPSLVLLLPSPATWCCEQRVTSPVLSKGNFENSNQFKDAVQGRLRPLIRQAMQRFPCIVTFAGDSFLSPF